MKIKTIITTYLVFICTFSFGQEIYTLEKCKVLALQNNTKAQNSQLSLEAAGQTKKEAFTKYFPSISATAMNFRSSDPMMSMELPLGAMLGNPEMPPISMGMLEKGLIGAAMATQPIFAGGQILNGNKLARLGVEVAELQKTLTDDEIVSTVEQYYWQILSLEEKMRTIAEAENLLNRVYTDVKNAVEAGVVNRNDLLKVELKQYELESGKLKLANGLRLSKMILAQFVGVSTDGFEIDTILSGNVPSPIEVRADHLSALTQRTEYRLLDKNIAANELLLKMKIGENLPTVAVGAGWNYMSFDKGGHMAMKNDFGMVFGTVSVPITNWWGGSHSIKKQKLQVQIAENDKRNAAEMLLIQMQHLWNELEETYTQIQLADRAIASALENLRLNTDYYEAGTGLLTDLLDAQNYLQQARDQHTEAVTSYCVKLAEYKLATAGI